MSTDSIHSMLMLVLCWSNNAPGVVHLGTWRMRPAPCYDLLTEVEMTVAPSANLEEKIKLKYLQTKTGFGPEGCQEKQENEGSEEHREKKKSVVFCLPQFPQFRSRISFVAVSSCPWRTACALDSSDAPEGLCGLADSCTYPSASPVPVLPLRSQHEIFMNSVTCSGRHVVAYWSQWCKLICAGMSESELLAAILMVRLSSLAVARSRA